MSHPTSIPLFALVETIETELCRAKLLPPLSLQVVTNTWPQARQRLLKGLRKHIRRIPPAHWAQCRPMHSPEHRIVKVTLNPGKDDFLWESPIEVDVDLFSWSIAGSNRQWLCPALDSVVVTSEAEVTDAFLILQVKSMMARIHDSWELEQVVETFGDRKFRISELARWTTREITDAYSDRSKGAKRIKLNALRSVATRIVTWKHSPTYEQQETISQLDELLLCPSPQSVLLVGPAGVGKTAIVFEWARTLPGLEFTANGEVSVSSSEKATDSLLSHGACDVWATSGSRLVSGMTCMGMWQKRCHQVVREAHEAKIILHVGSLVELVESGKINGQPGVATLLRSAIDKGKLLAIAECTPDQLAVVQREDPILLRCFTKLEINPPNEKSLWIILRKTGQYLTAEKALTAGPPKRKRSAPSERNVAVANLPDNAGTLFDASAIDELIRLHQRFSTYSAMPGQPISLMRSMIEVWPEGKPITDTDITRRFSDDTGLPLFLLDDLIPLESERLRAELAANVIGQPEPVEYLVRLITMLKARLNRTDRPLASLLLIGPTGVGKTETAKALAKLLYRDQARMIRIDMSEYSQPWSAIRLIGSTREGDGALTSPIRDQPFSVVLLDEFEKCHPSVLDLLLQVLGEGRLTDSLGRIADFRNAVIIMTSNLGVDTYQGQPFGFGENENNAYDHFLREVRRHVRPEFLGRLDQIIPYRPLPIEVVRKIADRELVEVSKRRGVRYHKIRWEVESSARDALASLGYDPVYGARPLRRVIERNIVIPLADCMHKSGTDSRPTVSFVVDETIDSAKPGILARSTAGGRANFVDPSDHENQKRLLDFLRDLRYRANLLIRSESFHAIENNVERISRQIERMRKTMRRLTSPRRKRTAMNRLQVLRQEFGVATKAIEHVDNVVRCIEQLHQTMIVQWHAQGLLETRATMMQATTLSNQLKAQLIGIRKDIQQPPGQQSLVLLCNPINAAKPLWQAYERLARLNGWRIVLFGLAPYAPLWDPLSKEFLERQADSRKIVEIPKSREPAFRLLRSAADPLHPKTKEIDVFRFDSWKELDAVGDHFCGIAIQADQGDIATWLGAEEGVHHFLSASPEGNKRHRARVLLVPGRLFHWEPFAGWNEPPSLPSRDPRRTFYASENRLVSHLVRHEVLVSSNDPIADWVEMIQHEGDTMLWKSIGYSPVPGNATFGQEMVSLSQGVR